MGSFKNTTDKIIKWLEGHGDINTVSFGDASEVDESTHTDFPIAHIIPLSGTFPDGYTTYQYQVLFLDTFENSKEEKIEVLDLQGKIANEFIKSINTGGLFGSGIHVSGTPSTDIIYNARLNKLYGWSVTVNVEVPNELINCG